MFSSLFEYILGTIICAAIWFYILDKNKRIPFLIRLPLIIASVYFAESWIYIAFTILYKIPGLIEALFNWFFSIFCFFAGWNMYEVGGNVEVVENIIGDLLAIPLFAGSFYYAFLLSIPLSDSDDGIDKKSKIAGALCQIVATLEMASLMIYRYVYIETTGVETYDMVIISLIIMACACISLWYTLKILFN